MLWYVSPRQFPFFQQDAPAGALAEAAASPTCRFTLGARDRSSGLVRRGVTSTKAPTPPRKGRAVLCLIIRALNAPALSTLIRSQMQRSRVRKADTPKRSCLPEESKRTSCACPNPWIPGRTRPVWATRTHCDLKKAPWPGIAPVLMVGAARRSPGAGLLLPHPLKP